MRGGGELEQLDEENGEHAAQQAWHVMLPRATEAPIYVIALTRSYGPFSPLMHPGAYCPSTVSDPTPISSTPVLLPPYFIENSG